MTIQKIEEQDLPAIVELEKLCFAHPMSEGNLRAFLLGEIGTGFVLRETDNGIALAYGGAMCVAGEAQIMNIATHPAYRKRGYAEKILCALLEWIVQKGAYAVTLEVREGNAPARALYEKRGFYEVGRIVRYYKSPVEDALILKKDLMT